MYILVSKVKMEEFWVKHIYVMNRILIGVTQRNIQNMSNETGNELVKGVCKVFNYISVSRYMSELL